jgi:signal transduction histidine kinase
VLFNLFLNAQEAMKGTHHGRLVVSASEQVEDGERAGRVVIEVRNTGKTIPPELLPHIFDALASTKSVDADGAYRCSGLGLALCRDLVEENGGTIVVESQAPDGTAFVIGLPGATSNPFPIPEATGGSFEGQRE